MTAFSRIPQRGNNDKPQGNNCLIGIKSHFIRWQPYIGPFIVQETVAMQVIGPRRKSTSIHLLNGHSIKPIPKDSALYSETNASLNLHLRSYICSRWWWGQRPTTGQEAEKKRWLNVQLMNLYPVLITIYCKY